MITSAQFIILQVINKCIGLAPITIKLEKKSFLQNFLDSIPIIVTSALSSCAATYLLHYPIFENGTIHGIINFASLLSVWLTVISGNGQCLFFSSAYQNINDQIRHIEKRYENNFSPEFAINFSRQYRRKVCLLLSLFFVSQGIVFYELRRRAGINGMWSSFLTSMLRSIFLMCMLQVVLYTDITAMFTRELCWSVEHSSTFLHSSNKFEFLKNVKKMHMDLWQLVVHVNRYFGWNLLCLLFKLFVYITLMLYWIFIAINNEVDVLGLIGK